MKIKINKRLFNFVTGREWLKNLLYFLLSIKIVDYIYRKFYSEVVKKKLAQFKFSDFTMSIETANVCNSKCRMCPYHRMTRPKQIMPQELFEKIVDDCLSHGIKTFNLNFYNEPFLDPEIFNRIKYLKNKGLKVKLFSNGSVLPTNQHDKLFESGLDVINFSFDALTKETYEKIRRGLSFDVVRENILSLAAEKKKRGLLYPAINLVFVRQETNKNEALEFKKYWEESGMVNKVILSQDDYRGEENDIAKKNGQGCYPCRKLWQEIIAVSSGKVPFCCFDFDASVVLGDFNTQTLAEIWNSEKFKALREAHINFKAERIPLCNRCLQSRKLNIRSWY